MDVREISDYNKHDDTGNSKVIFNIHDKTLRFKLHNAIQENCRYKRRAAF